MTAVATIADFAAVLERFENVQPAGDRRWSARCPAHKDNRNSLSMWIGRNGKLVIGCHAGCDKKAVLASANLTFRDLAGVVDDDRKPAQRRIVKVYDYQRADGSLAFQTIRYEPKDFRQRRPDGQGGWIHNLEGVERVLYQLPAINAAVGPGRTVFFCEGEKDADNLRRLGLTATTRVGGAMSPWVESYSSALRGAHVAIVPHNDSAGREAAAIVAGHLVVCGAHSIRLLHLHLAADHSDVSDWIMEGRKNGCQDGEIRKRINDHVLAVKPYRRG